MREKRETDMAPPDVARGYETRDISTRVVAIFAASLIVGAVLLNLAIWVIYVQFSKAADRAYPREYPLAHVGAPLEPPEPRLQTRPREDLRRMRADETRLLDSYGWVDAARGVVHIPIARAMALTVERGLPARTGAGAFAPASGPDPSNSGRTLPSSGR
jgi:hypothetical protein